MNPWRSSRLQAAALLSFFVCFSSAWIDEVPYHLEVLERYRYRREESIRGFRLNFTSSLEASGGALTAPTGELSTPGYPSLVPRHSKYREWKIEAPEGYRIQLDITDFDLGGATAQTTGNHDSNMMPRIIFFNDYDYRSYIKDILPTDTERQFFSTSNKMLVYYWSGSGSHEGFKARYSRILPASCGGQITNDRGTLLSRDDSIFNLPSFACNWKVQSPTMNTTTQTLAVTVSGEISSPVWRGYFSSCQYSMSNVLVYGESKQRISCINGKITTPVIVRSPLPVHTITATKSRWQSPVVNISLDYRWHQCGGILGGPSHVISTPVSTSYPIDCAWHAKFPGNGQTIELTFSQMDLNCDENYIIVKNGGPLAQQLGRYCGSIAPPKIVSRSNELWIEFHGEVSDSTFELRLETRRDGCGGVIEGGRSVHISNPGFSIISDANLNCIWVITAPPGKSVIIKFESFNLQYSTECGFDYLAVYSGLTINPDNRLALLCGKLDSTLDHVRSESGSMTIHFVTDSSFNFGGFSANIEFATRCGGEIHLSSPQTFRTQSGTTYDSSEDCQWVVKAHSGYIVKLTISSFDLRNSTSTLHNGQCSGDYIEVRDGGGPFSELIGKYCGSVVPSPITSSSNTLYIRFVSDATLNGNGMVARLESIPSPCGESILTVGHTTKILTSPNYPSAYSPGLRCRWSLTDENPGIHHRFTIHFVQLDLEDSENCNMDMLSISDRNTRNSISEELGRDLVISETPGQPKPHWRGSRIPHETHSYCGSAVPYDYHSMGNEVEIQFKSSERSRGRHIGFKLEYRINTCHQNDTVEQGSMSQIHASDCWFTIIAPVGHTISIYFDEFQSFDSCTENALVIYDGNFNNNFLATLCSDTLPNPVFSTGSELTFHSWARRPLYIGFDITYTTTDKGRGCGGKLHSDGGRFTSPLYPGPYQIEGECIWEVSATDDFQIKLEFKVFDLGRRSCSTDYVELVEVQPDGNNWRPTQYCGEDIPAVYHSTTGKVLVKYHTSVNNEGTGWVIDFTAKQNNRL